MSGRCPDTVTPRTYLDTTGNPSLSFSIRDNEITGVSTFNLIDGEVVSVNALETVPNADMSINLAAVDTLAEAFELKTGRWTDTITYRTYRDTTGNSSLRVSIWANA